MATTICCKIDSNTSINNNNNNNNDNNNWKILKKINTTKPCYIRQLCSSILQVPSISYISNYYYSGLYECLQSIKPNKYIICIGYNEGDFQIGLTGTCKYNENHKQAVIRETMEEIDITSKNFQLVSTKQKNRGCLINSYVYKLNATDCVQCTHQRSDMKKEDRRNNNRKEKITCIIYGDKEEIDNIMLHSRLSKNNKEKIKFYASLSVSEALNLCEILQLINNDNEYCCDTKIEYNFS